MSKFSIINQNTQNKIVAQATQAVSLEKNFTHAMITGETGSGKTTAAILPLLEDRIKQGHGIIFFDYKGTEHLKLKCLAQKHGRLEDVVMMNVPWGIKINIAKEANDKILEEFLFEKFGGNDKEKFWAHMATNVSVKCLGLLKKIYALDESKAFSRIFKGPIKDINPSFRSMAGKTKTLDDLKKFYDELKKYEQRICDHEKLAYQMVDNFGKDKFNIILRKDIRKLLDAQKSVKSFLGDFKQYGEKRDDNEQKQRLYGNYEFMLSAIYDVLDSDLLNKDEGSVSGLSGSGKIVVINANAMQNSVLSLITSSAILNLSKRTNRQTPVSVFIDEAQRVISGAADLGADVIREARVELILAFQNESILKSTLKSDERFKELAGNLTNQFFFRNSQPQYANGKYCDFSKLGDFEYSKNGRIFKGEPLFLNELDTLKAELEYQSINRIGERFAGEELDDDEILIYDEGLFKAENKFIRKKIGGGSESLCDGKLSDEEEQVLQKMAKIASNTVTKIAATDSYRKRTEIEL
nr:type IV secretion system DNA-binding domain-containing protein [uncultured Campylobacter sp.]